MSNKWKILSVSVATVSVILIGFYLIGSHDIENTGSNSLPEAAKTATSDKTSTSTPTSKTTTYSGSFSGGGQFKMPNTDNSSTCIFDDTFSGTINMDLTEMTDGSVNGTARVVGTFASIAVGGSIPGNTCVNATYPMGGTVTVSGTKNNIKFTTNVRSHKEVFTGSLSGNTISGTIIDTSGAGTGSAIIPVTLALQ